MPQQVPGGDQEIAAVVAALLLFVALIAAPPQAAAADPATIARGAYLAAGAGCDQCHTDTAHGGKRYAGGRALQTAFGAITTPNLTPDRATGMGRWSAADFGRAMRWGIAPDDSHYVPVFPFPFYGRLTESDLADIKAFLDSLPAVSHANRVGASGPALLQRAFAAIGVATGPRPAPWRPDPARDAAWNRGAYLVGGIGRCGDCHTPVTLAGKPDPRRFLAGGASALNGKGTPNITPDPTSGIGKWSRDDIVGLLTDGHTPDFDFVGGAMTEIVKNTSRLSEPDRRAIAVYLQSVPPVPSPARK